MQYRLGYAITRRNSFYPPHCALGFMGRTWSLFFKYGRTGELSIFLVHLWYTCILTMGIIRFVRVLFLSRSIFLLSHRLRTLLRLDSRPTTQSILGPPRSQLLNMSPGFLPTGASQRHEWTLACLRSAGSVGLLLQTGLEFCRPAWMDLICRGISDRSILSKFAVKALFCPRTPPAGSPLSPIVGFNAIVILTSPRDPARADVVPGSASRFFRLLFVRIAAESSEDQLH